MDSRSLKESLEEKEKTYATNNVFALKIHFR